MKTSYFLSIQVFIFKCRKVKVNIFRVTKHKKSQLQTVDVWLQFSVLLFSLLLYHQPEKLFLPI